MNAAEATKMNMNLIDYIRFAGFYNRLSDHQKVAVYRYAKLGAENITAYEKKVALKALDVVVGNYDLDFESDEWLDVVHALFGSFMELSDVL